MHEAIPTVTLQDGTEIPALGFGTWMMGEDHHARSQEVEAIRLALELGIRVIDTAEMYADGGAERIVGEALQDRREDAYLVSKVLPWNASFDGTIAACRNSLERLQSEYLDLYLLHWRGQHPLAETVAALEALKADGLVRAWGVSNFDVNDMEDLLSETGSENCATNQILYNLSRRGVEFDLLPWCQTRGIPVMAYSPIEQGRILKHPELIHIAKAYQATPAQVALAFLLERDSVIPIPKTANLQRLIENREAVDLDVSDEDWERLDAAFPPPDAKQPLAML
ncbi:aldo/keto reductase [Peteryoungia ipomoeae]|uniref:Aldo/keto reductase n=1 Tax=Peteryoungia ipomoeae TaxID=1210932 RepID=A0A4S8P7W0_9HYPH|nr:aldo/keto reductase [Peteryoungia ipomoeae]THV24892.1 aldo/keto reductase [Peteryoungia ipomoeae]